MEADVIYEDGDVLVCRKPPGIAVQTRNRLREDLESALRSREAAMGGDPASIYVVHRLDQPVGGVMVFAKSKRAASSLGRQIASGELGKQYYAMVDGSPPKKRGRLSDMLLKDPAKNYTSVVGEGTPGARRAELRYEVVESAGGRAVLRIELITGRHHQIRAQLAHAGMPIAGDRKYNFKANLSPAGEGIALCAYRICFLHPFTHRKMEFEIDKPFALT